VTPFIRFDDETSTSDSDNEIEDDFVYLAPDDIGSSDATTDTASTKQ
jgi:hypothetical protein